MKLVKGTTEWLFPPYTSITGLDFSVRNKDTPKAFQHGGLPVGDGKIDSRTIDVEIIVDAASQADYRLVTDEIKRRLYQENQKLYITDDRYLNIAGLLKWKEKFFPGYYLVQGTITATLQALDPFFYSPVPSSVTVAADTSPKTFTVNNPGNVDTPVKVTIAALDACVNISLKNKSDERAFIYQDVQFVEGKSLVVDCVDGTAARDGDNVLNNLSGSFLRLIRGTNTFEYTGGLATITIDFTTRWL